MQVYYVNLITKETRWIKPTEDHTAPQPTSKKEEGKKDYWEKKWKNDFQKWKSTNGAIAAAVSLEEMERKEKSPRCKVAPRVGEFRKGAVPIMRGVLVLFRAPS